MFTLRRCAQRKFLLGQFDKGVIGFIMSLLVIYFLHFTFQDLFCKCLIPPPPPPPPKLPLCCKSIVFPNGVKLYFYKEKP